MLGLLPNDKVIKLLARVFAPLVDAIFFTDKQLLLEAKPANETLPGFA